MEGIGRDYVNYCVKKIPKKLCLVPFNKVLKINERIATLRRAIRNGGLITRKEVLDTNNTQSMLYELGPPVVTLRFLTAREDSLIKKIITRFPWTAERLENLNSLTLRLGDDPIRAAMVDLLDKRLKGEQLHSCMDGRDWRLVDGLAATLRSGELYEEMNGKISPEMSVSNVRGRDIPLSRWCGGHRVKAPLASLLRLNKSVKDLASSIKRRIGESTMSNPRT